MSALQSTVTACMVSMFSFSNVNCRKSPKSAGHGSRQRCRDIITQHCQEQKLVVYVNANVDDGHVVLLSLVLCDQSHELHGIHCLSVAVDVLAQMGIVLE